LLIIGNDNPYNDPTYTNLGINNTLYYQSP
jgi:hypothetical protein